MTLLSVDETRTAFEGIRKQIKDLEVSIVAVYRSGSGPLDNHELSKMVSAAGEFLEQARGRMEALICFYDS